MLTLGEGGNLQITKNGKLVVGTLHLENGCSINIFLGDDPAVVVEGCVDFSGNLTVDISQLPHDPPFEETFCSRGYPNSTD